MTVRGQDGNRQPPNEQSSPLSRFVHDLARTRPLRDSLACHRFERGAPASYADLPSGFTASLATGGARLEVGPILAASGIARLYEHQAEALMALQAGQHVLTVTPTASGKSLIYVLPTLQTLAAEPGARALYLFPYKALEQDQLSALQGFIHAAGLDGKVTAAIYDGDTPSRERIQLRASPPGVLITNPDMLHLGLLAYHDEWRGFFANLRIVVVDELHVYRGIFGSHVHHVMRRLERVCGQYGARPRFIASSATIGNPGEFASTLLRVPFTVVDRCGAPRADQHFLFVNPAAGSPYTAAAHLIERCLRAGYRTIAFTKARRIAELLASWVAGTAPDLMPRIASYRAGYLASERRAIEARLNHGDLMGVISTSALEHGIDIGGLDACVLVGYPGSVMSAWQRAGRVGRAGRESLVALVALPDALDQYFMSNPGELFARGFERATLDPTNPVVASQHLVCAGAEIPLGAQDRATYPPATLALVEPLTRGGGLVADAAGHAWYSLRRHPQREVSLRAIGESYSIIDADTEKPIGTVEGARAFAECHVGAIYLHRGQQHEVVELDRVRRRVLARRVERDYYTQAMTEKQTEILETMASRQIGAFEVSLGRLRVTQEFREYVRRRISDQQKVSSHPLDLPPVVYETVGLWWEVPRAVQENLADRRLDFMGSLHASEHAAIALFPLLAICDRDDIGGISYALHPQVGGPAVFLYDGHPGGIGLATRGFEEFEQLIDRTRSLVASCPCAEGCPSCIQSPKCGSGNQPLDKAGAVVVLGSLATRSGQTGRLRAPRRPGESQIAVTSPVAFTPQGAATQPLAVMAPGTAPRPPATERRRLLFFDLETRRSAEEVGGWSRIDKMGLALAVVYDEAADTYRTYLEQDVDRLIVDLMSADCVVGFNLKRFDYTVLRGYRDAAFERIPTCDMLEEIYRVLGFRLGLQHLAEATLGEGKTADGLQSLEWFKEGRMDLIEQYCRRDVDVTRRLYHFGRQHGYLLYHDLDDRAMRVVVDW